MLQLMLCERREILSSEEWLLPLVSLPLLSLSYDRRERDGAREGGGERDTHRQTERGRDEGRGREREREREGEKF